MFENWLKTSAYLLQKKGFFSRIEIIVERGLLKSDE